MDLRDLVTQGSDWSISMSVCELEIEFCEFVRFLGSVNVDHKFLTTALMYKVFE